MIKYLTLTISLIAMAGVTISCGDSIPKPDYDEYFTKHDSDNGESTGDTAEVGSDSQSDAYRDVIATKDSDDFKEDDDNPKEDSEDLGQNDSDRRSDTDLSARDADKKEDFEADSDSDLEIEDLPDKDNNPDTEISDADRALICEEGSELDCYDGAEGTLDVGLCNAGVKVCSGNKWGPCTGQLLPTPEKCDNKDNDCDGSTDNILDGTPIFEACYTGPAGTLGVGICKAGKTYCIGGVWGVCESDVVPEAEDKCDANYLDEDCDGTPNRECPCSENDTRSCGYDTGECEAGEMVCSSDGIWGNCEGDTHPGDEICDGKDNNCNTEIDENLEQPCGNECGTGTETCSGGKWVGCSAPELPAEYGDICHGGEGECRKPGSIDCSGVCNAVPGESMAEICDGKDNDCDGTADNGFDLGTACGKGVCTGGHKLCSEDGLETHCSTDSQAVAEICDGLDNNCDGSIDETYPEDGEACATGEDGICSEGQKSCKNGVLECVQQNQVKAETCNGLDDNCDGNVDETFPEDGEACVTGEDGICSDGSFICNNGSLECQPKNEAVKEICNGLDDDCNGKVDDEANDAGKWFVDCDGDGYSNEKFDEFAVLHCDPKLDPEQMKIAMKVCEKEDATWTELAPSDRRTNDCEPYNNLVHPGQENFFSEPYKIGNIESFDYNCDGEEQVKYGMFGGCNEEDCTGAGFDGDLPDCGKYGKLVECGRDMTRECEKVLREEIELCI